MHHYQSITYHTLDSVGGDLRNTLQSARHIGWTLFRLNEQSASHSVLKRSGMSACSEQELGDLVLEDYTDSLDELVFRARELIFILPAEVH